MSSEIRSESHYANETFRHVDMACGALAESTFDECEFYGCTFVETVLRACSFISCTFVECDLSLAQLPETRFSDVRLEQCRLFGIDWTRAAWPRARLGKPLTFMRCALSHSTFIGLTLPRLQMHACAAQDVDFREADLTQASFSDTDLEKSLFGGTDLTKADLSRARNYRLDPAQNVLTQARFALPEALGLLYGMDIVLVDET